MYTDSHFHLFAMKERGIDINQVLSEMEDRNIWGIDIGTEADDLEKRSQLPCPDWLYRSAGIGPWGTEQKISDLKEQIAKHGPVVAIGEIGLDLHWKNYDPIAVQMELFEKQMDLAEEMGLPIIIHSREADLPMMECLSEREFSKQGIMHCFEGSETLMNLALDKGFYISFSGVITFKGNDRLGELVQKVPADRLLLETDSPYLSPVPKRGRPNTPLHIQYTYQKAAELRKLSVEELAAQVSENLREFVSQAETGSGE